MYTKSKHIIRYHNIGVCHKSSTCSFKVHLSCFAFTIQSMIPDTDHTTCLTTPSLLCYILSDHCMGNRTLRGSVTYLSVTLNDE